MPKTKIPVVESWIDSLLDQFPKSVICTFGNEKKRTVSIMIPSTLKENINLVKEIIEKMKIKRYNISEVYSYTKKYKLIDITTEIEVNL
jgi:hypothetical protein